MTLTTCFSQRILAGRFSDGCAPGPGTEFAPEQIRGTAHPRAVPTASTCCPRSPWTHIWRCEATTGLCTDSAIPPTSSHLTTIAVPKAARRPGSPPETCHTHLVPRRNFRYSTGRSACNLVLINKEPRHSPAVRQTFSDFSRWWRVAETSLACDDRSRCSPLRGEQWGRANVVPATGH